MAASRTNLPKRSFRTAGRRVVFWRFWDRSVLDEEGLFRVLVFESDVSGGLGLGGLAGSSM